jgi:lipase chaperone LimK
MSLRTHRWLVGAAIAAGILLIAAWLHLHPPATANSPTQRGAQPTASISAVAAIATLATSTEHAHAHAAPTMTASDAERVLRSGSLRGSQRDGLLAWAGDGRLIANRELRRLLDYYLSSIGELDADAIRVLLVTQLGAQYSPVQVAQVMAIFDRYRDYQLALMNDAPIADLSAQLARLHELRLRYLGAEIADAFFREDENYATHTLAQHDLATDPDLSAEQRTTRLAELDATLPESLHDERTLALTPMLIDTQEAQLDAAHADADTRHDARAAQWGEPAAQRLDALDAQRADWQSRLIAYQNWRDAIKANPALNDIQRRAAIGDLLARSFQDTERVRIQSLEQEGL